MNNTEKLKEILDLEDIPFSIEQIRSLFILCNKGRSKIDKYGKKRIPRGGRHRIMEFCCCLKPYFYNNQERSSGIYAEHKCDCCKLFIQCDDCFDEHQWIFLYGKTICIDCSDRFNFVEKRYKSRARLTVVRKDNGKVWGQIRFDPNIW